MFARLQKVVWNRGDSRCKLVTLARNQAIQSAQSLSMAASSGSSASSSGSGSSTDG